MSLELALIIALSNMCILLLVVVIRRKIPKKVKKTHYTKKWREIQKLCSNKEDWAHAIVHADMLLDEVMKKKRVGGKTTGERLVNVQKQLSTNDQVWVAHKLSNSLRTNGDRVLKEEEVKDSLIAFRQALRDLGALR